MKVMTKRSALILLAGILLLVGGMGCSLSRRVASRLALEPTATMAPTMTLRPTFTATPDWTPTPTITPTPTNTPIPTETPTPVPTDTPTPVPATDTPVPTATFTPGPPTATFTPAPPTATPAPSYPFFVEGSTLDGHRDFTHTTNNFTLIFVEILDSGKNIPLGGYKVVGDSTTGLHYESAESCWDFCGMTPPGGYAKVANVKFEPGPFIDGAWSIYVVDGGGKQVSPVVTFPYSTNPDQWVWDHVLFRKR